QQPVADLRIPVPANPTPVAASRINRRWRAVALASPELWTNIRVSHRSRSWHWAALFSYRIDKEGYSHPAPIPLSKAIAMLCPHIGRWRTFALRAFFNQLVEFCAIVAQSSVAPSRLESAHLSSVDYSTRLPLAGFSPSESFCALRVPLALMPDDPTVSRALRTCDLDCGHYFDHRRTPAFRALVGPSSSLTTLVLRNFWLESIIEPIECWTIQYFALDVSRLAADELEMEGEGIVQFLTNTFRLPNLEHLELLGWLSGSRTDNRQARAREAPLFPHLHTLRLEDMTFSRASVTALQLICTGRNHHLLSQPGAWPNLRALTVETKGGDPTRWLVPFMATRAASSTPISDITLPVWLEYVSPTLVSMAAPAPTIHWQTSGPSHALMDGVYGPGFYDDFDMRPVDFEHVTRRGRRLCSYCGGDCRFDVLWIQELAMERLEEEIEFNFKTAGAVAREVRRGFEVDSEIRKRKASKFRKDLSEDFSVLVA
ncbi:hypothetical protein GGX14DRAFT_426455, partial [Mycena pura]